MRVKRALLALAFAAVACSEAIDHGDSPCDSSTCACGEECIHGSCAPRESPLCTSDHDCDAGFFCHEVFRSPHFCGYSQCQMPDAGH